MITETARCREIEAARQIALITAIILDGVLSEVEIIKILIQQLDGENFNYKLKGNLLKNNLLIEWQSFSREPVFYENKAYRLV